MEIIEIKRDEVIRWIHSVEFGKPVRMAGLITELYFSKKLHDAYSKGQFSCVAEGWFYVTQLEHDKSIRHWCRLADPDSSALSTVELAFIERFYPLGHRFFFLSWDIFVEEGGTNLSPEITISAVEWLTNNGEIMSANSSESHNLEVRINLELRTYLSTVSFSSKKGWNVDIPFFKWLRSVEDNSLRELFVQRCLMNSSITLRPLDLDAMALDKTNGKLVFLEFKRKYPTQGGSKPKTEAARPRNFFEFANDMQERLLLLDLVKSEDAMIKFKEECKNCNFYYQSGASFGLDLKHFETMIFCEKTEIEYRYVIWNAGKKEPNSSPGMLSKTNKALIETNKALIETNNGLIKTNKALIHTNTALIALNEALLELDALLSLQIQPHVRPKWWVKTLKSSDVKGITHTFGADSGSYSKKIRLQVIFDEE